MPARTLLQETRKPLQVQTRPYDRDGGVEAESQAMMSRMCPNGDHRGYGSHPVFLSYMMTPPDGDQGQVIPHQKGKKASRGRLHQGCAFPFVFGSSAASIRRVSNARLRVLSHTRPPTVFQHAVMSSIVWSRSSLIHIALPTASKASALVSIFQLCPLLNGIDHTSEGDPRTMTESRESDSGKSHHPGRSKATMRRW